MNCKLEIVWNTHTPKYIQLANAIEKWIAREQLPTGSRLPSTRQLANRYQLTTETVNRGLRELLSRKVISRRIGSGTYVGTAQQTVRIGLVCNTLFLPDNSYVSPFLIAIGHFWRERGFDLLTLVRDCGQYEAVFAEFNLAGLFVFGPDENGIARINQLREVALPVVGFGVPEPGTNPALFGLNSSGTVTSQVNYLLRLGHRRIALIGNPRTYSDRVREQEMIRCLWEKRIPFNPDSIIYAAPDQRLIDNAHFLALMTGPERPTALLLLDGEKAISLSEALAQMQLRIPEDVSVMGADDHDWATVLMPALTVFRQPVDKMACQACEQLWRMIHREPLLVKTLFRAELILRQSCSAPPADAGSEPATVGENTEKETDPVIVYHIANSK